MAIEDKSGRRPGSAGNVAAEEALRESEERYRILFESIDQGFCVIEVVFDDADSPVDYRFLETNPAFEHHTGLYNVQGQLVRSLVPLHEDHWFETYGRVALTGRPERFINHAQWLDDRWFDVFAFRIGQPEERKVAVLFSDITGRKLAEDALRELNEELEERVQQRTEQVRNLASQLTMAEHEERARIAQVLHDDLQQQLYALQIQIAFLRAEASGEAMRREIDGMEALLTGALETARQLSIDLSPPVLEGEGLVEAIQWLGSQMFQRYQLRLAVEADSPVAVLGRDRRVLLFQMVRELLFNVVKHSGVSEAEVRLEVDGDTALGEAYCIEVIDRGAGFDVAAAFGPGTRPDGRGLLHLRERLHLIGGRLEVQSIPGDGTHITMIAPVYRGAAAVPPALPEEE
jgi:PAS domain S-box-containing protein